MPSVTILALANPLHWRSPLMLPVAAAVGAALFFAVVWLYPPQVRLVRRPWRWVLPGLRATALLVLAATLAQPVAIRARAGDDRSAVLVLFDRSRSMNVCDVPTDPAALVALADGMGLLPEGKRAAPAAQFERDVDELQSTLRDIARAAADLDYARVSGHGIETADARLRETVDRFSRNAKATAERAKPLIADEGNMRATLRALGRLPPYEPRGAWTVETGKKLDEAARAVGNHQSAADRKLYQSDVAVRAVCDGSKGRTRLDLSREAATRPGIGLAARLNGEVPAVGFTFAGDLQPIGPLRAAAATTRPSGIDETFAESSDGSPLAGVSADGFGTDLAGAVAAAVKRYEPGAVRAAVVYSDGRQAGPEGATLSTLAAAGVPVYTVLASAGRPNDVAFATVTARDAVYLGETMTVRAELAPDPKSGPKPELSAVRLQVGDDPERKPDRIDAARRAVEFAVKMEQPGAQRLLVSIPPVSGEATAENNVVRRWVKVLPGRIRVAAFASAAGRDFQYLRAALARAPGIELDAGILDAAAPKLPLSPDQILEQDVILLADVPSRALDEAQWRAVHTLVTKRGGSVVLVAGDGQATAEYADNWAAAELLPWKTYGRRPAWRVWPGERPNFRAVPAAGYERSDVLRLADGDATNARWYELPALFRVLAMPELKENVRTLLTEPELAVPVLTEVRAGLGRSLFLGTNETWRWRLKTGEQDQDRFWRQLIHFAAENPYAIRGGALALDLDRVAVAPGAPVGVRARAYDEQVVALGPNALRLEATRDEDGAVVRSQALAAAPAGSGRFAATLEGLPAGEYQVQLVGATADGGQQRLSVPLRVEATYEQELRDVSADPDRLTRLSQATGGQMLRLDQLGRLPDLLSAAGDERPRVSEMPLWDSPFLFAFVLCCFGAEWALRKRFGLS